MQDAAAAQPFTLEVERTGEKALVHCHGRLVAGHTKPLSDAVNPLIPECKLIVLDLTDMKFMDSMGLGVLVRLYVSGKSSGCRVQLVNLGKQIRELLGITNLLSVLTDMCEQGVTLRF